MEPAKRVLAIGASDPGGQTGIQTDLRTLTRMGIEATAVVTGLSAPSSNVFRHPGRVYAAGVREQMSTLRDFRPDAVKVGVLPTEEVVSAVALEVGQLGGVPVVVDVTTSAGRTGSAASQETIDAIRWDLLQAVTVVTVSWADAADLVGLALSPADTVRGVLELGPAWVLIRGVGQQDRGREDLLSDGQKWYTLSSHLTGPGDPDAGATFGAALTALIAGGAEVPEAARQARQWLLDAAQAPSAGEASGAVTVEAG